MVLKTLLEITLLLLLIGRIVNGSPERCQNGHCVSPRRCESGYFQGRQFRPAPFPFCCYDSADQYKTTYKSSPERLLKLDCRFKEVSNFPRTEAHQDVRFLDISFNELHQKGQYLRDFFLQYFTQLRALLISTSNLGTVPANFLRRNRDLERLDLSVNRLQELPEDLLVSCPNLVKVDFSWNAISTIPKDFFKHNPRILEIKLAWNQLKRLTSGILKHTPALEYWDVSHNALECISSSVLNSTPNITYVGLQNTGIQLPHLIRDNFCYRDCTQEVWYLKRLLLLYSPRRYYYYPRAKDPCTDGGRE